MEGAMKKTNNRIKLTCLGLASLAAWGLFSLPPSEPLGVKPEPSINQSPVKEGQKKVLPDNKLPSPETSQRTSEVSITNQSSGPGELAMAECIKVIKTWEKTHAKPVKGIGAAGSTLTLYLPPPDADLIAQMQSLTDKFGLAQHATLQYLEQAGVPMNEHRVMIYVADEINPDNDKINIMHIDRYENIVMDPISGLTTVTAKEGHTVSLDRKSGSRATARFAHLFSILDQTEP